ncbi:hypothetical protein [Actinomadura sp. SCN-SB]|uniref:hypothetical protein n=1 Tax=Actinomadura sp. SCN-SB TaxID=3373092 RepID=UPI00375142F0
MNPRTTLLILVAAGCVLLTATLLAHRHRTQPGRTPAQGTPRPPATAASTPDSIASTRPSMAAAEIVRLLPFRQEEIAAGVQVARRFTAAYGTWRYNEDPRQYLARLTPMASDQLRPQLERAATDPTTTSHRRRLHQTSTGQARAEAIRGLGPTSITVILTGTQHLATPHTAWQDTSRYAVTLTHHGRGRGWRVYAFDLAATGDAGDTPTSERGRNGP